MPLKPCLECNQLSEQGRCPEHRRPRRHRPTRERNRRAWAVAQHRATYGDMCPGWQCDPHPSSDLTADHITPVAAGGAESGPLAVLCRSCNSAKGSARG